MDRTGRSFSHLPRILVALAFILTTPLAFAGPPLVCWKVLTDGTKSLPWSDKTSGWDGARSDYDTHRLVPDTLDLLAPATPVLERMETLRRAAIYANRDRKAGEELMRALADRAQQSERRGAPDALAFFDAGYLAEAWKQAAGDHETEFLARILETVGIRKSPPAPPGSTSGYDWVRRALALNGGNAEMEYAAALITWWPRQASHEGHVARAAEGAREGSALARNLLERFRDRGKTIEEIRASVR